MFEITKIRLKRAKTITLYGLAIYGAMSLMRGCQDESMGYEMQKIRGNRIEYKVMQNDGAKEGESSLLESRIENIYMRSE